MIKNSKQVTAKDSGSCDLQIYWGVSQHRFNSTNNCQWTHNDK